jgi:hypothetical protein
LTAGKEAHSCSRSVTLANRSTNDFTRLTIEREPEPLLIALATDK